MSLDLSEGPPETPSRKKAAWALGVIALVAVIISVVMVFALGSSNDPTHSVGVPVPTGSAPPLDSSPIPSFSASAVASPARASVPVAATTATCPTSAPCIVAGDGGNAAGAVLAYRASHGAAPVPVSVSSVAQTCALHEGDEPSCPQGYYWEPVSALNGTALVTKIATHAAGAAMLTDPKAKSYSVGWAFVPSGAGGQIQAVVVENS